MGAGAFLALCSLAVYRHRSYEATALGLRQQLVRSLRRPLHLQSMTYEYDNALQGWGAHRVSKIKGTAAARALRRPPSVQEESCSPARSASSDIGGILRRCRTAD